jgi:hypothetical protein
MPSQISVQYGSFFTYTAFILGGLLPCGNGINALIRPESALALLRFPEPSDLEAQKLTRSLIYLYGARELSLGLTVLSLWYSGYRKPLGWVILAILPIVIGDGLASLHQIGGGEWSHWVFAPVCLGIGAGLLGWI